jgi:uncharacterized protein with NRDE domain
MCLILIVNRPQEQVPLLVLANRDEFYARPTAAAGPWQETPELIGGRDLVSGGSWFAARGTRWASVTNIREGLSHSHSHRSRGWLVRDYLLSEAGPEEFLDVIAEQSAEYAGFNLLLGHGDEIWYGNNRGLPRRLLEPGIYGLSNHLLDTPWPKVVRAKQALTDTLAEAQPPDDQLFAILADTTQAPDSELPETGIPIEWERALSATFISTENYGTRCTTLFQRHDCGRHLLIERRFAGHPDNWDQATFTW